MLILGLGSNCGDRLRFLKEAIRQLKACAGLEVLAISPLYESNALLPEGAPKNWNLPFLNLALKCRTAHSPTDLLKQIKTIENQIGRKVRGRWAPREIDIDILAVGDLILDQDGLKIPHPGLLDRPFAALPFADLAPDWRHPGKSNGTSIAELTAQWRRSSAESIPSQTQRSTQVLTEIVGVLNLTPDSFSDGDPYLTLAKSIERAKRLKNQGARILDIGAQSTRPGSRLLETNEEWGRLEPVLAELVHDPEFYNSTQISVDTRSFEVAERAIEAGAHWINDVEGFADPRMRKLVAQSRVSAVTMHSLTIPADKKVFVPVEQDLCATLLKWGKRQIETLQEFGISKDRIILDPGIGFGKSREQDWDLMRNVGQLQTLGVPLFVGHSRKYFLSMITTEPPAQRDCETNWLVSHLASQGIDYIRVHNPETAIRTLRVWSQIDGITRCYPPTNA